MIEWKSCWKAVLSIFVLYLGITYWPSVQQFAGMILGAALPLLLGCAIAYVVNILMSFYEKHYFTKSRNAALIKSKRPVCMIAAFLTLILVVVFVVLLIVPQLVSCGRTLLEGVPGVLEKAVVWINQLDILPEDIAQRLAGIDWQSKIAQIVKTLTTGIGNVTGALVSIVSTAVSSVVTGVLGVIFSLYLLSGKENLSRQMKKLANRYIPAGKRQKLQHVLRVVDDSFHKYIVGQCIEAVILGSMCAVGMALLQLPYAAMIGALTCFTALIPVAGAYISAFIGAFLILTVSPVKAIIFLVFIVVLQQIEGNLVYPRVVGSSLGLPGIWVLAAVTVGGGVMGIAGMLLGVPLASAIYRLLKEDVNKDALPETAAVTGVSGDEI